MPPRAHCRRDGARAHAELPASPPSQALRRNCRGDRRIDIFLTGPRHWEQQSAVMRRALLEGRA